MLSPIQQLENFEESEIQLEPQELLPIMEVGYEHNVIVELL